MILLFAFLYLMFLHLLGDFVLQSHWMAVNKSKNILALLAHVGVYTATLFVGSLVGSLFFGGIPLILLFILTFLYAVVNGLVHFGVDLVTSRISSRLFRKGAYHNFFVVIGIDQFIHYLTLAGTLALVYNEVTNMVIHLW